MSYSNRKLKLFVENMDGHLEAAKSVAEQLCLAEDDGELAEVGALLTSDSFYHNSFWGVARGSQAAQAVVSAERKYLQYAWTTPLQPITSRCFVREGYVRILPGCHQLLQRTMYEDAIQCHGAGWQWWYRLRQSAANTFSWTPFTIFGSMKSYFFQKRIREYVVVRDGKVAYRDVSYEWWMAKQ